MTENDMAASHRREDDPRIERIERLVDELVKEVGKVRTRLGERNTTLIYDLDQRYMPREELKAVFIPRAEHIQNASQQRAWRLQLPMIAFAGLGWVTTIVELLTKAHR